MATADSASLPTAADVEAAAKRLAGVAMRTPLVNSPVLDARLGARVFLKAETLQRTGSFKFRGAYNKISSIPPEQARRRRRGLFVRQSRAGRGARGAALRHAGGDRDAVGRAAGQARAHRGARRRGRALRPRHARIARRSRATSRDKRGAVLVPPFDDPMVIAGQGTAGREIVRGSGRARAEARRGGGRRLRRRADRRHRARDEGAGAGREILLGRAGRLRRHRALVQERQARGQSRA